MMKDGLIGIAFTLATASRSVPSASGFAALSKPIWLSLICRNVNPVGSAARASPIIPTEWGTPPLTAQSTPVPAQTMHSSTSRRPNPCPRSSKPFLAMLHLPVGQTAPNGAAKTGDSAVSGFIPKKYTISRASDFATEINRLRWPRQPMLVEILLERIPFRNAPDAVQCALRERQPAPGLTMTLPFMFGWIEHR